MMRPLLALLALDPEYRKLEFRGAFLLYLVVLVAGSIPGARAEVGELASGLVLHVLTYSVIALLLFCGADGEVSRKARKAFLIVVAMGAVDEYVQSFFPYRRASVLDWLTDAGSGLSMSILLSLAWPKIVRACSPLVPAPRAAPVRK